MHDQLSVGRPSTPFAQPRLLMLHWAPYSSRSAELARALGAECHFVHVLAFQRPLLAPLKYPLEMVITWQILLRARPHGVIVANPPLPAVICAAVYSRWQGARFVIDTHSAALVDRKWAWSRPAQRWLGRRAAATLVHTPALLPHLGAAGHTLVVEDPPLTLPPDVPRTARSSPRVVVVGSFAADEPIAAILSAAARTPDVQFVLTGDPRRAEPEMLQLLPSNASLAGWLDFVDYVALLRSANVIVALTTRDLTLLRGAWEAVYLGKPLVTSGWAVQRACFPHGTVFVHNDAASIAAGIQEALRDQERLQGDMESLRADKLNAWSDALATLRHLLSAATNEVGDTMCEQTE